MRKLFALILLIPVAILFMGWARLSSLCGSAACGSFGIVAKAEAKCPGMTCCSQTKGCGKAKDACSKDKDQSKGKEAGSCCLDCPMCTVVTVNPFIRFEHVRAVSLVEYAVMSDNNLKDYSQKHWKPPAANFFS